MFASFDQDEKCACDDTINGSNCEKNAEKRQCLSIMRILVGTIPHVQRYMIETEPSGVGCKVRDI